MTECAVKGCKRPPQERKPFCTDHIDRLPYAAQIIEEVEEHERCLDLLNTGQSIPLDAIVVQEALHHLREHGRMTVPGLRRYLHLKKRQANTLVTILKRAKLIKIGNTTRNHRTVELI